MTTLEQITEYVWANQPRRRDVPKEKLARWVNWHMAQGWIAVANCRNEICGCCVVRPIMDVMDAFAALEYDQEGKGLYIAEAIATEPGALMMLGFVMLKRFGPNRFEYVCWHRKDKKLQVHSAHSLRRNLFRMKLERALVK